MITALIGIAKFLFNPKVLLGIAVVACLWWVHHSIDAKGYKRGYDEAVAKLLPRIVGLEKARDIAEAKAKAADAEYRRKESDWATLIIEQQSEYEAKQTEHQRFLAAALADSRRYSADNNRLRDRLSTYAAGNGQATPDTPASASARAAALGGLLAEALSLADAALLVGAENSAAAESNGDAVRALLKAWPR